MAAAAIVPESITFFRRTGSPLAVLLSLNTMAARSACVLARIAHHRGDPRARDLYLSRARKHLAAAEDADPDAPALDEARKALAQTEDVIWPKPVAVAL